MHFLNSLKLCFMITHELKDEGKVDQETCMWGEGMDAVSDQHLDPTALEPIELLFWTSGLG